MTDLRRGDVVLLAFPFVQSGGVVRKMRPAVVVQADHYNRRREAVILAAITSTQARSNLPCKVAVSQDSPEGRAAGLRTDSVVDCQTVVTLPKEEVVRRLGAFPTEVVQRIDQALSDSLGLSRISK